MSVSTDVFLPLQSEIYGQTHRTTRKLANNTYGTLTGGDSVYGQTATVRYHATDVVVATLNRVTYHTGGWYTVTTKERINRYLPQGWRLWSDKNVWQVGRYTANGYVDISRFYDGISFVDDADGNAIVEFPQDATDPAAELRKRIKKYAALYTDERVAQLMETSSLGDCLFCQIRGEVGTFTDTEHLESHLDESYTMLSLAYNALAFVGYRDPVFILQIKASDMVRRAVRKYLTAKLVKDAAGSQG